MKGDTMRVPSKAILFLSDLHINSIFAPCLVQITLLKTKKYHFLN